MYYASCYLISTISGICEIYDPIDRLGYRPYHDNGTISPNLYLLECKSHIKFFAFIATCESSIS